MTPNQFMTRVRTALRAWQPPAESHPPPTAPATAPAPPTADAPTDLGARFAEALQTVGGSVYRATSLEDASQRVVEIIRAHEARAIIVTRHPEVREVLPALASCGAQITVVGFPSGTTPTRAQRDAQRAIMADADVVVSGADYAIAETGTLAMVAGPHNPRSATLLPPVHVAILDPACIAPTMLDLIARFKADHLHGGRLDVSGVTFISGPSRTGDIEQTLSVGVHGPGEVHVILLQRSLP